MKRAIDVVISGWPTPRRRLLKLVIAADTGSIDAEMFKYSSGRNATPRARFTTLYRRVLQSSPFYNARASLPRPPPPRLALYCRSHRPT